MDWRWFISVSKSLAMVFPTQYGLYIKRKHLKGMYSVNVDYNPEPQAEAREGLGSQSRTTSRSKGRTWITIQNHKQKQGKDLDHNPEPQAEAREGLGSQSRTTSRSKGRTWIIFISPFFCCYMIYV
ncbi:hypothetical protein SDJN03_24192, partial [Cucurbita argyrosperma subsp. sororia]